MSGTFRVSVSKDYLVFAAAHFITFRGHQCEALHGHNYRLAVAVEGGLDEEIRWVLDFSELKRIARGLVDEVDHLVLLPATSTKLALDERDGRIEVRVGDEPRYLFPADECARLPIPNTTVEMLADYFAWRIRDALAEALGAGMANLTLLEVEVEESPGQSATRRLPLGGGA